MLNSHVFALYNSFAVHWDRQKYFGMPKIQYFFDFFEKSVKKYIHQPECMGFFGFFRFWAAYWPKMEIFDFFLFFLSKYIKMHRKNQERAGFEKKVLYSPPLIRDEMEISTLNAISGKSRKLK